MRLNGYLLAAATALASTLPLMPEAEASPVTYSFSVLANSGPLTGTTAAGTFSYDTSSIVPGGFNDNTGLLTALSFTWNGITYDATTANTGSLGFDGTGVLTLDTFGTNCGIGSCSVIGGVEGWDVFVSFPIVQFDYAVPGSDEVFLGTVTQRLLVATSEPSALALLAAGLAGLTLLGIGRRRRPGQP